MSRRETAERAKFEFGVSSNLGSVLIINYSLALSSRPFRFKAGCSRRPHSPCEVVPKSISPSPGFSRAGPAQFQSSAGPFAQPEQIRFFELALFQFGQPIRAQLQVIGMAKDVPERF